MGISTSFSHLFHPIKTIQNQQAEEDAQKRIMQAQANAAERNGQIMTAQAKQELLGMGSQVRDNSIGPSVQQTTQTSPDLPTAVPAAMQAQDTMQLPGEQPVPYTPGGSGLSGKLLDTGGTTTADRPADASRMFTFKTPGGKDLSVELDPDYPLTHHAMLAHEMRQANATPRTLPNGQVVNMTDEEYATKGVPQMLHYSGQMGGAQLRAGASNYAADQRLAGTEAGVEGRAVEGSANRDSRESMNADNITSREKIAGGREHAMKYAADLRNSLGLSTLQVRVAQNAAVNARGGGSEAARKNATVMTRLQRHRDELAAAVQSGVMLDRTGYQTKLKPEGLKYLQSQLDGADKDLAGFQAAITPPATTAPAAAGGGARIQEGHTATNPKTGAKMVFRGGQWAPQ